MPLLNYTTKIDADKTAHEIAKCLQTHGAMAVLTEYNQEEGLVEAISFKIDMNGQPLTFRLPCDYKPVYAVLVKGKKVPWDARRKEKFESEWKLQAVRTAWRIVKDWVEAQMALVETHMVTTAQVFLPYAVMKDGKTLSEKMATNPGLLLGDGN